MKGPLRSVVESFYADVWNRHDKSKIPDLLLPGLAFRGSLEHVISPSL